MDVIKLLNELKSQRDLITQAIVVLERLAIGTAKRRGRPPKWLAVEAAPEREPAAPGRRRAISAEARKRMAEAQKRRWAAARQAQGGS